MEKLKFKIKSNKIMSRCISTLQKYKNLYLMQNIASRENERFNLRKQISSSYGYHDAG